MRKLFLMACGLAVLSAMAFSPVSDTFAKGADIGPTASCGIADCTCISREVFVDSDDIWVMGGMKFEANAKVDIYVVPSQNSWANGDPLYDLAGSGPLGVQADADGKISCQKIWGAPLALGDYDIIGDAAGGNDPNAPNGGPDGFYTETLDAVESPGFYVSHPGDLEAFEDDPDIAFFTVTLDAADDHEFNDICPGAPEVVVGDADIEDIKFGKDDLDITIELANLGETKTTVTVVGEIRMRLKGSPIFESLPNQTVTIDPSDLAEVEWEQPTNLGLGEYEVRYKLCIDQKCFDACDPIASGFTEPFLIGP